MTSLSSKSSGSYHPLAYKFVFTALRFTQEQLGRDKTSEKTGHISGPELLEGIRQLGLQHFGMLCPIVFRRWGIQTTDDFGHIVFRMIESGVYESVLGAVVGHHSIPLQAKSTMSIVH